LATLDSLWSFRAPDMFVLLFCWVFVGFFASKWPECSPHPSSSLDFSKTLLAAHYNLGTHMRLKREKPHYYLLAEFERRHCKRDLSPV